MASRLQWVALVLLCAGAGARAQGVEERIVHVEYGDPSTWPTPNFTASSLPPSSWPLGGSPIEGRGLAVRKTPGSNPYQGCTLWVGPAEKYKKVQDAVNRAGSGPATICIRPGTYQGQVTVKGNGITIIGGGKNTVLTGALTRSITGNPWYAATLIVQGNYFVGKGFVVENSFKTSWDATPAVTLMGQKSAWYGVSFNAWLDTVAVFTGGHYFRGCYVSGLADFIWGFGRAAFEDSQIFIRKFDSSKIIYTGFVTAFGTDSRYSTRTAGAVFYNCQILGDGRAYLGRPYRDELTVAYINSNIAAVVPSAVWSDWDNMVKNGKVQYLMYGCYGRANLSQMKYAKTGSLKALPSYLLPQNFVK